MPEITYEGQTVNIVENETLLDGLLRNDFEIFHSCKAGACQCCLLKLNEVSDASLAQIAAAQENLKPAQKKLGYFLSCLCKPQAAISVVANDKQNQSLATIKSKTMLNENILELILDSDQRFIGGQYVTLSKDDQHARSYSIANIDQGHNEIILNIKCYENGLFSQWAKNELTVGDQLKMLSPLGECIYALAEDKRHIPLLLASMGTGLAPIYAILQDALAHKHSGAIDVVVGAKQSQDFYYVRPLQQLAANHENVNIHFVTQDNNADLEYAQQVDVYQYVKDNFIVYTTSQFYLCGAKSFVNKLRKQIYLKGAQLKDIHCDIFTPAVD